MSIFPDKQNNRILAGSGGNGILVFDTLQRLVKHIKISNKNGLIASPNCIIKNNEGDYIIFATGEKQAWKLNKDLSRFSTIPISSSLPDNKSGTSFLKFSISKQRRGRYTNTRQALPGEFCQ